MNAKQLVKQQERQDSIKSLKKFVRPGKQVYTRLVSVSKSGMTRRLRFYVVRSGELVEITWHIARILDWSMNDQGLKVTGCGMDMGFHTVYSLSSALYPKGFKLAKGQYGRNGDKSGFDTDGGYALKNCWL